MSAEFNFSDLHPQLVQAVVESGYTTPTPIQSAAIPLMMAGHDVIGQAQTGTGKTAAYALPILHNMQPGSRSVQCLVLTPTRELAMQVATAMYEYGQHRRIEVLAVYGGQSYSRQINRIRRGVDVVVGTPGRLLDLMRQGLLDLQGVKYLVLDEADEMLSMGFIEDIEAILAGTPAERQTALFSATMPSEIRRLADQYMREPQTITVQREQMTVPAIEQRYYLVSERDKMAALTRLFEVEPITSALIFARTRASSGDLASELTNRGFPAEVLNGDLAQETRERVLRRFREKQIKVLVATDVAARGLDIDDISHVFNFDLPEDPEIYVHRVGRTARAGKEGIAISLATPADHWRIRRIEGFARTKINRATLPTEQEIMAKREEELVTQLSVWLKRARFRRERELVAALAEEGHDPLDLAAAALKLARAEEKQRPIYAVTEIQETRPSHSNRAPDRGFSHTSRGAQSHERGFNRANRAEPVSHENGMVRLSISKGRAQGVRPNDVVSTIAYHANIPGNTIGKIHIHDNHTLVDIPNQFVAQVLAKTSSYRIHKQPVSVEVAKNA